MRIQLFPHDGMTEAQTASMERILGGPRGALVGPFRAALHRPELTDAWQEFGAMLRFGSSIPRHLNELAIIVAGRRWNSQVEWTIHSAAAIEHGIAPEIVDAIRQATPPVFHDDDEAANVYEFARQLVCDGNVEDEVYSYLHARFGDVGMVDLSTVIGYYTMVSMTLNVHEVGLPAGVEATMPYLGRALTELPACTRA